jgi:hypothetical protein
MPLFSTELELTDRAIVEKDALRLTGWVRWNLGRHTKTLQILDSPPRAPGFCRDKSSKPGRGHQPRLSYGAMGSVGLSPLTSRHGTDSYQSWFWKNHTRVSYQSSNGVVGFDGGNILINNRSAVVEHVMSQTAQNKRGVAFAYCDSRDEDKSKAKNILASLVQQLCRQQDNPDTIDDIFSKSMSHASGSPAWNQLAEILLNIGKSFDESYLLVDALEVL